MRRAAIAALLLVVAPRSHRRRTRTRRAAPRAHRASGGRAATRRRARGGLDGRARGPPVEGLRGLRIFRDPDQGRRARLELRRGAEGLTDDYIAFPPAISRIGRAWTIRFSSESSEGEIRLTRAPARRHGAALGARPRGRLRRACDDELGHACGHGARVRAHPDGHTDDRRRRMARLARAPLGHVLPQLARVGPRRAPGWSTRAEARPGCSSGSTGEIS